MPREFGVFRFFYPSLCPLPDGGFLLAYKSRKETLGNLQVGVAYAQHYLGL